MKVIAETERLIIREVTSADAEFMLALLNSEGWLNFIGDRGVRTVSEAENYLKERVISSYSENGFGMYNVVSKATNEVMGMCGLVNRPTLDDIDIGFGFLPQFFGKGYAYEAATAIMNLAVNDLKIEKIVAITTVDNIRSQKLLEKIGLSIVKQMKIEGDDAALYLYSN